MEAFQKIAAQALSVALDRPVSVTEMETPPDPTLGDLAFPCFKMSKELRKAPPAISAEVAAKLNEKPELLEGLSAKAVGPYVNFTVPASLLLKEVLTPIANSGAELEYGRVAKDSRETWVVEYSSPNVAKPFMIYHFRPTGLGACIERVGRFRGYKMISINHLGDWGTQFGKLFVAHELYGAELPAEPEIDDLVKIYVKLHEAIEKDVQLLSSVVKLDDQGQRTFSGLFRNKHKVLSQKDLSDERKAVLAESIDAKIKATLTPAQNELLAKRPEVVKQLIH
ncbi:MAG: arginine--tRNA ligase [Flavobacterium sp.]|nr:MAG: arginine--tRNA ligase [Flavobacterium sp.]